MKPIILRPHLSRPVSDLDGHLKPMTAQEAWITAGLVVLMTAPVIAIPLTRPKPSQEQAAMQAQMERDRAEVRRMVQEIKAERARAEEARQELARLRGHR